MPNPLLKLLQKNILLGLEILVSPKGFNLSMKSIFDFTAKLTLNNQNKHFNFFPIESEMLQ